MNKILTIIKKILTVVVFLPLPIVVFIMVTSNTSLVANIRSMVVLSGSMQPVMPLGSLVFVKKADSYNISDVISFTNKNNTIVTHRIIEKVDNSFRVKGDANNSPDTELVDGNSIIGKEVFMIPLVGYFIHFLKTPKGFLVFIIIPAVIYIFLELFSIKKEIDKEVEKRVTARLNKQHET